MRKGRTSCADHGSVPQSFRRSLLLAEERAHPTTQISASIDDVATLAPAVGLELGYSTYPMRCRFASLNSPTEQERLRRFDERTLGFYQQLLGGARGELGDALAAVDRDFELLSVQIEGDATRIDVRSSVARRRWLERFARARPPRVEVVTQRGPLSFDRTCGRVAELTGCDVSQARVRAGITRGHLFELVLYLSEVSSPTSPTSAVEFAAELAVEGCLGERRVEDWIQSIDVAPLPRESPLKVVQSRPSSTDSFPLSELELAIDRAVRSLLASLPETPLCEQGLKSDWVMLEAEPTEEATRPQADLIMASTFLPEMLKCFLQEAPFASVRFSRHGERFVYLKYPAQGELAGRVRERQLLEDAIDAELRGSGLGCVVGNGLGRTHCYIDLALLHLDESLPLLCRVAQGAGISRQAAVWFCDSDWQDEWIDIWEPPVRCA